MRPQEEGRPEAPTKWVVIGHSLASLGVEQARNYVYPVKRMVALLPTPHKHQTTTSPPPDKKITNEHPPT